MAFKLEFTPKQWEEIESMSFPGFEPVAGEPMERAQWIGLGHMALGKAYRIEQGEYGEPEDDMDDNTEWAEELRAIADVVFNEFRPGDMKV